MPVSYFVRMRAHPGQEHAVHELLLTNLERIRQGEQGNLSFAVHVSRQDPREFWLYETWIDDDAVARHESGRAFNDYKQRLRPMVEADSVVFGDTEPLATLGAAPTLAERFVQAMGSNDQTLLDQLYASDVLLYTPLGWPIRGLEAVKEFVGQFHTANPGLRVTLHDQFSSADGQRHCFRFVIHFKNTGPFYGKPPTGEQGTMSETHAVRLRDGKIVEQFVGDNNFAMPYQELAEWHMDFPRETPDPNPVITEASAAPNERAAHRG
jgi:quinol monooxygenase YgiN